MKKLSKLEARRIIDEWYSNIEDNNDKSSNGVNFKIHPISGNRWNLDVRKEIIDIHINEFDDLYLRHKDDHKDLMQRLVSSEVALKSINSLLEKKSNTTGVAISAPKLILDLARIAFDNKFKATDITITESEKLKIINDVKSRHEDYLSALRIMDFYVGSNQAGLQFGLFKSKTGRVIDLWQSKKKTVSRISNINSRRLDMFGQYAIYFNANYGSPLWSDVLSITSAFYDCDDTSPENVRITLSKKLGLTRHKP